MRILSIFRVAHFEHFRVLSLNQGSKDGLRPPGEYWGLSITN